MSIEHSPFRVTGVELVEHGSKNGGVDGVGSVCRAIFVAQGLEEVAEHWFELAVGSKSRIFATQVGNPLANGREGFLDRISSDRFVTLPFESVAESPDEEVGESVVGWSVQEIRGLAELFAEVLPVSEDLGLGCSMLGGVGSGGQVESSAEVSNEVYTGFRRRSTQGLSCG